MRLRAGALALLLAALPPAVATAEDPVAALGLIRPNPAKPAKEFRAPALAGGQVRLSDFKGKTVFLNFWATWCKPCEEEMPAMERLWRRYKDKGLVVLAVSLDADGAASVTPFVKRHKLTFPVALDPKMEVAGLYGVWALPTTFIIDRKGDRVLFANGPRDWGSKAATELFASLLK